MFSQVLSKLLTYWQCIEIVYGDPNDELALCKVFMEAAGVFIVTSFYDFISSLGFKYMAICGYLTLLHILSAIYREEDCLMQSLLQVMDARGSHSSWKTESLQ